MSQNSIGFIIPFFGKNNLLFEKPKFPRYFQQFIGTFSHCRSVDLKIITNLDFKDYLHYESERISFVKMSFLDYVSLTRKKVKSTLNYFNFRPYKICDFKPAFGAIFSEELKGYDYWGYCDLDMIIGNLDRWFTEENMKGYDLISASQGNPGYMTVYRNCDRMNTLYQKSPDFQKVFNSTQNYRFDEKGNKGIFALRQTVAQEGIKVHNLQNLVHNDCSSLNQDRDWRYLWQKGQLVDALTGLEIGSFHLIKIKQNKDFTIAPFDSEQCFEITRQGVKASSQSLL